MPGDGRHPVEARAARDGLLAALFEVEDVDVRNLLHWRALVARVGWTQLVVAGGKQLARPGEARRRPQHRQRDAVLAVAAVRVRAQCRFVVGTLGEASGAGHAHVLVRLDAGLAGEALGQRQVEDVVDVQVAVALLVLVGRRLGSVLLRLVHVAAALVRTETRAQVVRRRQTRDRCGWTCNFYL